MNIDLLCITAIFPWNRFLMTLQKKKKCGDVTIFYCVLLLFLTGGQCKRADWFELSFLDRLDILNLLMSYCFCISVAVYSVLTKVVILTLFVVMNINIIHKLIASVRRGIMSLYKPTQRKFMMPPYLGSSINMTELVFGHFNFIFSPIG